VGAQILRSEKCKPELTNPSYFNNISANLLCRIIFVANVQNCPGMEEKYSHKLDILLYLALTMPSLLISIKVADKFTFPYIRANFVLGQLVLCKNF